MELVIKGAKKSFTVKLSAKAGTALARLCAVLGVSKSTLVQEALRVYLLPRLPSAYELGKGWFGRYGSGDGNNSTCRHQRYREFVREKRSMR